MASPMWFSKQLFQDALIDHYKDKTLSVLGYSCTSVVPTGDNYTSDLYRAAITYKIGKDNNKEAISVIVKSSPQGGLMEELAKSINLFEKEIHMFSRILPAIYKILGESASLSSESYHVHVDGPHSLLILEDLKPHGYVMHERQNGLDLAHSLLVMERIAKLHAASVVMYDKEPSIIPKIFDQGLYCHVEMIKEWCLMSYRTCYKSVAKWSGFEKYAKKMEKLDGSFFEKAIAASDRNLGDFNVLNHGDMWVNNMMFQYDTKGKLTNMRFVDFQLCKYASQAVDLHYFIATSPSDEVRGEYLEHLLDHYYSHFLSSLTTLRYPLERVPSRAEFRSDFNSRAAYGLMAAVTVASLVKADHRKDANFENLMKFEGEGSFRDHCYTNQKFRKLMEQLLPYYDNLGVLD